MKFTPFLTAAALIAMPIQTNAHIALLSPAPLLDGFTDRGRTLKVPPFGAPGIDVVAAPSTPMKAGATIDVKLDAYVYHPGYIVALWTRDPEAKDLPLILSIPSQSSPIPHGNLLTTVDTPCHPVDGCKIQRKSVPFTFQVTLPDVEGEIYLVIRQVMYDKFDVQDDGSVDLRRIYYHQASKLNLSK